ncbi:oligopeptide ABC transporter, ATP-binding protein, partial [Vibrio harveyi]
STG